MPTVLKIPYAERAGSLIHVAEVTSGLQADCFCPACKGPVVARKGPKVVHHFAHFAPTNCQPETVAHLTAKRLLTARISKALSQHTPFPITWQCQTCHGTHEGNLVRKATRVETELSLPGCRPDISLLDPSGQVLAVIEIIVTHEPEQGVRDYCSANKITLAEYTVKTHADLEKINAEVLPLDRVDLCLRLACPKCDLPLGERRLFVLDGHCWKCQAQMRMAKVEVDGYSAGPEDFTPAEIALAHQSGAVLKKHYSRTREEAYLANTCVQCGAFTGQHYLFTSLDEEPGDAGTVTGYSCHECDYKRSLPPAREQPHHPQS